MTPLNHQLLGVAAVIVFLGVIGLMAALWERIAVLSERRLSEADRPIEMINSIQYAAPDQYRAEYAALLTLLHWMREQVQREQAREPMPPATRSTR